MADKKISQLTAATTPLAGTEVLPIVQSGSTVKVSAADVTAGRAVSASSVAVTGSTPPANGVYLPAANAVGISTASANAVYINSSGDVSIAQGNAPTQVLNIYRGGSNAAYMAAGNGPSGLNGTYFGVDASGNAVINQTQALNISVSRSGTERVGVNATETVVNDTGANLDFRVEGDNSAYLLYAKASSDVVGLNTSAPIRLLTLGGGKDVMFLNTAGDGATNTTLGRISSNVRSYGTNIGTASFASIEFATDTTDWFKGEMRFLTNATDGTDGAGTVRMKIGANGNITASTGNLIMATAGKGIDFSANTHATGMTKEILDWYEEGSYTPTVASTTGTITSYTATAWYTRIGRQVTLIANVTITDAGTGAGTCTITLPFTNNATVVANGVGRENAISGDLLQGSISASGTVVNVVKYTNATAIATNAQIRITISYFV